MGEKAIRLMLDILDKVWEAVVSPYGCVCKTDIGSNLRRKRKCIS